MSVATSTALTIAGLGVSAAGAGASASGGKKARNDAKDNAQQQFKLQKDQIEISKNQLAAGMSAFNPARDYWTSLLKGGQVARVAVGPISQEVQNVSQATRDSIQNNLPRGGERNLATAKSYVQEGNDLSRLYAGVQPAAATNLAQLSAIAGGQGVALMPQANTAGAQQYFNQNSIMATNSANDAAGAFGGNLQRYLYQKANKKDEGRV